MFLVQLRISRENRKEEEGGESDEKREGKKHEVSSGSASQAKDPKLLRLVLPLPRYRVLKERSPAGSPIHYIPPQLI